MWQNPLSYNFYMYLLSQIYLTAFYSTLQFKQTKVHFYWNKLIISPLYNYSTRFYLTFNSHLYIFLLYTKRVKWVGKTISSYYLKTISDFIKFPSRSSFFLSSWLTFHPSKPSISPPSRKNPQSLLLFLSLFILLWCKTSLLLAI